MASQACQEAIVSLLHETSTLLIMLLLTLSGNGGAFLFAFLYWMGFLEDGNPENQDITGYFGMLAFANTLVHVGLFATLSFTGQIVTDLVQQTDGETQKGTQALSDAEDPERMPLCSNSDGVNRNGISCDTERKAKDTDNGCNGDGHNDPATVLPILTSAKYHLLLWPCVTMMSLRIVMIVNLDSIVQSFGIVKYAQFIPFVSPIHSITMKLILGITSYMFNLHLPLLSLLTGAALVSVISFIASAYFIDNVYVLIILIMAWTMGGGLTSSFLPALCGKIYGRHVCSLTLGAINTASACMLFLLQTAFGLIYDHATGTSANICYGYLCYRPFFWLATSISALSAGLLFSVLLWERRKCSGNY